MDSPLDLNSESYLSNRDIDLRVRAETFPELELLWAKFIELREEASAIDASRLERIRHRHMRPLFGYPKIAMCAIFIGSFLGVFGFALFVGPNSVVDVAFLFAATLGLVFLALLFITWLQRNLMFPLNRVLGRELAAMLTQKDFGNRVRKSAYGLAIQRTLYELGHTGSWDDPTYLRKYLSHGSEVQLMPSTTDAEFILTTLRKFLGRKDPELRQFIQGIFFGDLLEGKRSINLFLARYDSLLHDLKGNQCDLQLALESFEFLKNLLRSSSKGDAYISDCIEALKRGSLLFGNVVQAEIWVRDPWVDLTHQREFYSSASLRGVHWMGRSSKGRLGPFNYLRNPAISCLDLRTSTGRKIRCRLLTVREASSQDPVLFVDGVEGSNAISPILIYRAIEDYASSIGIGSVLYNASVRNQIPQRFVGYLAKAGLELRQVSLALIGGERNGKLAETDFEYLDGFGYPLEPFEYAHPSGWVLVYVKANLSQTSRRIGIGITPTILFRVREFIRMNLLWLLFGYATLFGLSSI